MRGGSAPAIRRALTVAECDHAALRRLDGRLVQGELAEADVDPRRTAFAGEAIGVADDSWDPRKVAGVGSGGADGQRGEERSR